MTPTIDNLYLRLFNPNDYVVRTAGNSLQPAEVDDVHFLRVSSKAAAIIETHGIEVVGFVVDGVLMEVRTAEDPVECGVVEVEAPDDEPEEDPSDDVDPDEAAKRLEDSGVLDDNPTDTDDSEDTDDGEDTEDFFGDLDEHTFEELDEMTKDDLQDILRDQDKKISGNKDELIERVLEG